MMYLVIGTEIKRLQCGHLCFSSSKLLFLLFAVGVIINFMCQLDWAMNAQIKHHLGECLWWCFQVRSAFKSVNSVKRRWPFPVWVGIIQSVGGLDRTKKQRKE
jgi:hypothetical protein